MANRHFEFDDVVFFGRSIEEYVLMFNLELSDLVGKTVLDCCAGPSAFARQAAEIGIHVTACDPRYADGLSALANLVEAHSDEVARKQQAAPKLFHPELVPVSQRKLAMRDFLEDFEPGRAIRRYVPGRLPELPFKEKHFDKVLCGNLLFIYSDTAVGGIMPSSPLDYAFHLDSIRELMRVACDDVRIYPLQGPGRHRHEWLDSIVEDLAANGMSAKLVPVKQRDIGAENMMIVTRA